MVRPARAPITMPAIAPPERPWWEVEVPGRVIGMMWACWEVCQVHWEREKFLRS